jgi:predicted TIM-barrel enzyme
MAIKISGVNIVDDAQNLRITGVSTFTNGPVLIGTGTSTGTASQRLQVTGGAYVSGNLGIGTTSLCEVFILQSQEVTRSFVFKIQAPLRALTVRLS